MSPQSFAFFDLDDTLVDTRAALRSWAADFVREHELGDETVVAEVVVRRTESSASWIEFTGRLREWYGITADPREMYERMLTEYTSKFTLDPSTAAGLKRLREDGWLLGIVTNGVARMQDAKIDQRVCGSTSTSCSPPEPSDTTSRTCGSSRRPPPPSASP